MSSIVVNADHGGEQPSLSLAGRHGVAGDNTNFIMMDYLVQDMGDGRGDEDGEPALLVSEEA